MYGHFCPLTPSTNSYLCMAHKGHCLVQSFVEANARLVTILVTYFPEQDAHKHGETEIYHCSIHLILATGFLVLIESNEYAFQNIQRCFFNYIY